MPEYVVSWGIELQADNRTDAARKAVEMISDPESVAHVFMVAEIDEATGNLLEDQVTIDIDKIEGRV